MQMDLDKLLENYMTLGGEIFQAQSSIFGLRHMVSDKYNSNSIQNLCQRWFGVTTMDRAKVPTLIMAYDLSEGMPEMIRSFDDEGRYPACQYSPIRTGQYQAEAIEPIAKLIMYCVRSVGFSANAVAIAAKPMTVRVLHVF